MTDMEKSPAKKKLPDLRDIEKSGEHLKNFKAQNV
jgi:hypothetical protein